MRWPRLRLTPVARQRWQRFRRNRRALFALSLLVALYAVSLCSELLCNSRPLLVRFRGRWYAPVLRYYPETVFVENGQPTRPDYRALSRSPLFAGNPTNWMAFPPLPYSPGEDVDPASMVPYETVELTLTPSAMGSVVLDADGRVDRPVNASRFFGTNHAAVTGLRLADTWTLDAAIVEGLERRLAGLDGAEVTAMARARMPRARDVLMRLRALPARGSPRATVQLLLLGNPDARSVRRIELDRDGGVRSGGRDWRSIPEDGRALCLAKAREAIGQGSIAFKVTADGEELDGMARYKPATWPFRPVPEHPLGIDESGRDVLARVLYGLRISMTFGLLLAGLAMVVGSLFGALQGYYAGWVDLAGQRLTEIWGALPFLYVIIFLGDVFGTEYRFLLLLAVYALFNWIGISYYMRAEFLRLRGRAFVDAARCLGVSSPSIMWRHILPNALTPLITFFPFSLVGAIGSLTALDFLGFGLPPDWPSWGELLQQARSAPRAWWLIVYPSLALFVVMLLGVLVGEGVRDAMDPHPRSRME